MVNASQDEQDFITTEALVLALVPLECSNRGLQLSSYRGPELPHHKELVCTKFRKNVNGVNVVNVIATFYGLDINFMGGLGPV